MYKSYEILNKKTITSALLLFVVIIVFFQFYRITSLCTIDEVRSALCLDTLYYLRLLAETLCLFLLPVLFTLPLKPAVFTAWRKFAVWAVPLGAVLAYHFATMPTSGFIDVRPMMYTTFLYLIYFLVSFIIIGRTWWKGKRS